LTAVSGCPQVTPNPADGGASREPVAHWIAAKLGGRRLAARTLECAGHYAHAARCALVFAENLLEEPRRAGCFDPEEVFTLDELKSKLARSGIRTVDADPG
jgi:hypothetical protein